MKEPALSWRRILMCGLATGLIWAFLSVPLFVLFGRNLFEAVPLPLVTAGRVGSFVLHVVAGVWAVWLYAAIRPYYGTGARAAGIAGFSWWLIASIATWQWADLGFIRGRDVAALMLASLPLLIAATMVGARAYQKEDTAPR